VAHGLGDGLAGATAAASPSVALVGSRELLVISIRSAADLSNQRSARETQDLRHNRMSLPIVGLGRPWPTRVASSRRLFHRDR
jgi:hypothetical protein